MTKVGIIVNPEAGKDIRRIVAEAEFISNFTKMNVLKRIVIGLDYTGVDEVILAPDYGGISEAVFESLKSRVSTSLAMIDMVVKGTVEDTIRASRLLREEAVDIIMSLGGDGTLRAVFKGAGHVALAHIPLGTNNALGAFYEPTTLGMITGLVVKGKIPRSQVFTKLKTVKALIDDVTTDLGLADLAVAEGAFTGSRAIWDVEGIKYVAITKGEPSSVGLTSLAGFLEPISLEDDYWLFVELGYGFRCPIVLAPGLICEVKVKHYTKKSIGELVELPQLSRPHVLAFDGEREVVVPSGACLTIKVDRDGPPLLRFERAFKLLKEKFKLTEALES